jgi:uncharacterized protein (DUF1330 family)
MKTRYTAALAMLAGLGLGAAAVQGLHAQAKPPAYTIIEVEVTDPATYQKYMEGATTVYQQAGGRFIVRGGKTFVVNGTLPKRIAVIQWESLEKAQALFDSDAYKQLIPIRDKSSNFRAFVVEGLAN